MIILVLILVGRIVGSDYREESVEVRAGSSREEIPLSETDRLLVIAPHPDDETIAAGRLISKALAAKIPVCVVIMTSGDGNEKTAKAALKINDPQPQDYCRFGRIRHNESVKAMSLIGLPRRNLVFLTYPDGGLDSLFNTDWDYTKPHIGRTGVTRSPYDYAYDKNAVYCGANVVRDLEGVISTFRPTTIVFPGHEDSHPDHWATNAFVQYSLTDLRFTAREYTYLVHSQENWPEPRAFEPTAPLQPPIIDDGRAVWHKLPLTSTQEQTKMAAVRQYNTQLLLPRPALEFFIRRNELFASRPDIALTRIPSDAESSAIQTVPGRIFFDPPENLLRGLSPEGDLKSLAFSFNDRRVWVKTEGAANIDSSLLYTVNIRVFKKNLKDQSLVTRYDARFSDDQAVFAKNALNSGRPVNASFLRNGRDGLVLEMPASILKGADYVMICASTYSKNSRERQPLDRTGWYRIALK
jgi:LmbE family N-acetylglucosaminyl deacetylase